MLHQELRSESHKHVNTDNFITSQTATSHFQKLLQIWPLWLSKEITASVTCAALGIFLSVVCQSVV